MIRVEMDLAQFILLTTPDHNAVQTHRKSRFEIDALTLPSQVGNHALRAARRGLSECAFAKTAAFINQLARAANAVPARLLLTISKTSGP
jgi:hypothetical protein